MRNLGSLKSLWMTSIIFLAGCSDRPIEIIDAAMPSRIHSELLNQETLVIIVRTKGDLYNSLKDDGGFYLFKSPCNGEGEMEEIGFIIDDLDIRNNKWIFAIDDNHLQGDGYLGIAKGDCVFVKTKPYFFSPQYRSNIIALH